MIVTSGYGKNEIYGPKSDCRYFTDISKRTDNRLVKSYPCSNRPVICEQCDTCYWSYNLVEHYRKSHPCLECPEQIPPEERTKTKKLLKKILICIVLGVYLGFTRIQFFQHMFLKKTKK